MVFNDISAVLNIKTNKIVRMIGKSESNRFVNVGLYQGAPKKKGVYTLVSYLNSSEGL
jgi:peptidylprolyl isomerase domain and WD repeat-containing protein 1